ncbi:MAG TPA: alpha/beta hydrolase [Candidatus Saccharimonadales bacterium]|nr:alpha/beta hydrolase [Candidatus Saccharimonadales bacterium]
MQIVVDGVLTRYEQIGHKPQTLLILHGWMRSLDEWLPVAKQLSESYRVILLDFPGFGKTEKPKTDFTIYDYATFVEQFLDKLEINKVTLLGHSFGGRVGIIMASKSNKISDLVLVDAAGVEKRTTAAKIKISIFKLAKVFLPKKLVTKLRNKIGSRDYKSAGEMRKIFLNVINEDLTYLLSKISQPTYIIWGNKDEEVPQWKTKKMKQLIPHTRLRVVWGSGHSPHLEKPLDFMEILNDLLNLK